MPKRLLVAADTPAAEETRKQSGGDFLIFDAFAPSKAKQESADFPIFDAFEQPKVTQGRGSFPPLP
jgi:hypothetical protein